MSNHLNRVMVLLIVIFFCFCVFACEKKEPGKVVITESEYTLEHDGNYTYSLNAKGKVKNIGNVDVKNVVVTGYCKSCDERMISGKWFVTQQVKTDAQKDTLGYLTAGVEEPFSFKDIAYYYTKEGEAPPELPEGLDVVVESFETVQ